MEIITLKVLGNRIGPIVGRHPWVFSQAIVKIPDGIAPGTPVRLIDEKGVFLALGYFNSYAQLAVRLWGFDPKETIDKQFFLQRINRAIHIRRQYVETPQTDSYRLINGESDLLPGLIVDKYADCLTVQFHTRGIELYKALIIEALTEALAPKGIYERSDVSVRTKDGEAGATGTLYGDIPDMVQIKENGLKFLIDIKGGQKTGFYLDQRDKRFALMKYAKDATVLNCFSYTGGFSVYALAAGASRVTSVDVSAPALELAKENIKLNNLDESKCEFIAMDVKRYIRDPAHGLFDVIVLDPPAFVKDRRKKPEGMAGYKTINEAALRMISAEGGVLLSCSCSAHVRADEFRYMLSECCASVHRTSSVLESYTQGVDHPVLVPFLEGDYLKCYYLKIG